MHVLHLACHARQDQDNPLDSGFELKDGRLTLGQLMQVSMPHAQFAFLSTCESAGMDHSRPDECLNLAGAMIFAGFRSVFLGQCGEFSRVCLPEVFSELHVVGP